MKDVFLISILTLALSSSWMTAQENVEYPPLRLLTLHLTPGVTLPLGADSQLFDTGYRADLMARYRLPEHTPLTIEGGIDYLYSPIKARISMSTIGGGLGCGYTLAFLESFFARAYLRAGYAYSSFNEGVSKGVGAGGMFINTGLQIGYRISQEWSVGLEAGYANYGNLIQGLSIMIAPSYVFNLDAKDALKVNQLEFQEVYPVLFDHYKKEPIGRLSADNVEQYKVKDLAVTMKLEKYSVTDFNTTAEAPLATGQSTQFGLKPALLPDVLKIEGGKEETSDVVKVPAAVRMRYSYQGWWYEKEIKKDLLVHTLRETDWKKPQTLSAFVLPQSGPVSDFAARTKTATASASNAPLDRNLLVAAAVFNSLKERGIQRRDNPLNPFMKSFNAKSGAAKLAFPPDVLTRGFGDYDELALLFCSLLEAQQVPSALIVTDSMIYPAFAVNARPQFIKNLFVHGDICIVKGERAWIPVDPADFTLPFGEAVQKARAAISDSAKLLPIRDSWESYPSYAYAPARAPAQYPDADKVKESYAADVLSFINWEIASSETELKGKIETTNQAADPVNKLGVLYAKYGLYERAEVRFRQATMRQDYLAALVNSAHLFTLQGDYQRALPLYQRASRVNPDDGRVLLSLALCQAGLNNVSSARSIYARLKKIDPAMAERAEFLDEARASAGSKAATPAVPGLDQFGPAAALPDELREAAAAYNKGDFEGARRLCETAYELDPYNPAVLAALGTVEFRQGDFSKAKTRHQKLASIDPDMAGRFAILADPPRAYSDEQIRESVQLIWLND